MSSQFIPPSGKKNPAQQPQVNVAALEAAVAAAPTVSCDNCKNVTFQEVQMFKALSEVSSPTGKAGLFPLSVFACNACGFVNEGFLPLFMRKNQITKADLSDLAKETEQPVQSSKIEIVR